MSATPRVRAPEFQGRGWPNTNEPLTLRTLTDPAAIRTQVRLAREAGHALALEQVLMGEIALGVAIPDADGRPVAAIHIAGSLAEWEPEEFRRRVAPLAAEAAGAISSA